MLWNNPNLYHFEDGRAYSYAPRFPRSSAHYISYPIMGLGQFSEVHFQNPSTKLRLLTELYIYARSLLRTLG